MAFDPDEFLKKKDVPSPKKPFDPDAFLASDPPLMSPVPPESLQDASVSTQRNPYIRQLAEGRLKERNESDYLGRPIPADQLNGQLDEGTIQNSMAHMRANRMDRAPIENANQHWYSPIEDRQLSDEELRAKVVQDSQKGEENRKDIGNLLHGIGDFKAPWVGEDDPAKSMLARGVGTMETLFPTTSHNPDESLPFNQRRDQNREIEQEVRNLRKEQSPNAHSAGRMAGDVIAYNSIMKLLGGVGLGPAAAGEAGAVGGSAGAGAKKGVELMKAVLRGGTAGAGVGQLSGSEAKDAPMDAALGAGFEAILPALGIGKDWVKDWLRKTNERGTLPKIIANTLEKPLWWRKQFREDAEKLARESFDSEKQVVKNQIDELKTQRGNVSSKNSEKLADLKELNSQAKDEGLAAYSYNKTLARNNLRDLSENEPAALGEKFLNKIKESKQKLSKEYGQVSDKLMNQHGDFPAPAENLRNEIADILSKNGLINPDGKIDSKTLDLVQSPERKRMLQSLLNMRQALQENPSVRSLNALKQDLQSLANYGAPIRTAEQGTFGKLSEHAKSALDDALSQAAGSEAGEFQAVRKKYAQQKPALDALSKTATRLPERLVVNARVQFPKSKVQELLKTNPEFKDDIGNFVFEHITQTPASQNTIRKTMDYYGRDFLKDLVGEKRFNLLQKAEEQLTSASAKFNPKNFPNEEAQRRIGEILGDEMGPYSFDSAKKTISRKDAEAAAKSDFEIEKLKKKLLKKFEYTDPSVKKFQEKLLGILGKSKELKPNKRLEKVLGSFRAMFPAASNAARLNLDQ